MEDGCDYKKEGFISDGFSGGEQGARAASPPPLHISKPSTNFVLFCNWLPGHHSSVLVSQTNFDNQPLELILSSIQSAEDISKPI